MGNKELDKGLCYLVNEGIGLSLSMSVPKGQEGPSQAHNAGILCVGLYDYSNNVGHNGLNTSGLTNESTIEPKKFHGEWDYFNRGCLMIMKYHMEESTGDSIPQVDTTKEFMDIVRKK